MKISAFIAILLLGLSPAHSEDQSDFTYRLPILKVVDADTFRIPVPDGSPLATKFCKGYILLRIDEGDAAESSQPPAKCDEEVQRGKQATEFAKKMVKLGRLYTVRITSADKYGCRYVGTLELDQGDYMTLLIKKKFARPYGINGNLTKSDWCK